MCLAGKQWPRVAGAEHCWSPWSGSKADGMSSCIFSVWDVGDTQAGGCSIGDPLGNHFSPNRLFHFDMKL